MTIDTTADGVKIAKLLNKTNRNLINSINYLIDMFNAVSTYNLNILSTKDYNIIDYKKRIKLFVDEKKYNFAKKRAENILGVELTHKAFINFLITNFLKK